MKSILGSKQKPQGFLLLILILQLTTYLLIFFDISIARQIIGFVYFSFIPGFVIVKLLKMDKFDKLETVLFSVGFSIAILMLIGLSINELYLFFGIAHPLSLTTILLTINNFTLIMSIIVYLRNRNIKLFTNRYPRSSYFALSLLLSLPILSILGAMWVYAYENNIVLLAVIVLISVIFTTTVILKRPAVRKLYPIIIFVIALSLIYHSSLISKYPLSYGSDLARELFISTNTLEDAYWNPSSSYSNMRYGRVHSMLSVTILPTIYSNLLNLELNWIFKIIYPTIFTLVPLGLYVTWKEKLGSKTSFISAFLFMANGTFYTEMLGLNRQMIAELFFVLLLFIVLSDKIKSSNRIICFIIFSLALVTSHYALAEIFMFFISLSLILLIATKNPSRKITISMIILFFVIMFSWYIYTAGSSTFRSLVSYCDYVYRSLSDIFNPQAREPEVLRGLGLEPPPTIWNAMSRGFAYMTEFLIVMGFIGLVSRKVQTKVKFNKEFFMFVTVAMMLLGLLIIIPGLSSTMNMTRFYHILLLFIAPLSVIGADFLIGLFKKGNKTLISLFLIFILVPYFLFQIGFVYEIVGTDSWSLPLSMYRMPAHRSRGFLGFIDGRDIFGVCWLKNNLDLHDVTIYADISSINYALFSYSMIPKEEMIVLSNVTTIASNSVIYLSSLNTISDTIMGIDYVWNTTNFPLLSDLSKVYTNGACEVYVSD